MQRVIAGKYKNRKLVFPESNDIRPTKERVKEALFSSIGAKLPGKLFLDLFAGSGQNAIEAVSRGAMKAIAVDKSSEAIKSIETNISELGINNVQAHKRDVEGYLNSVKGLKFDFIFIDAPYDELELYHNVIKTIDQFNLLNDLGYVIIETSNEKVVPELKNLIKINTKNYGKSKLIYLSKNI